MANSRFGAHSSAAADSVERFATFDPATLYEAAGQKGMVDPSIRPAWPGARVCGRAATVECPPGDNLMLHIAVANARPGVIIVANVSSYMSAGAWGEILTAAAQARGVAGLVIDGAVRDIDAIRDTSFPVFSRGLAIGSCTKERPGTLDIPVQLGGATVRPGDLILGDADGLVVIEQERLDAVYKRRSPDASGSPRSSASFGRDAPRSSCWDWWTRGINERYRLTPGAGVNAQRYRHEDMYDYGCRVLERLDVPAGDAADVCGCLTKAELRGVDSHGMVRLPVYSRRLQAGVVNARPVIQRVASATASSLIDGDNGLGPVVGARAMNAALDLAQEYGTGFVGVRNSNHFGPAAYYVEKAVDRGCIGLAISNAPPNMAPFGGKSRFLGTNPVAIGVPAGEEPPLIFDASTSVVARGKIIVAAHSGKPIPEGWAIRFGRLPDHRCAPGARRGSLAVRRPERIRDLLHHRRVLRCADRGRVRIASEHAREPRGRAECRACVRRRSNRPVRSAGRVHQADGRHPADAQSLASGPRRHRARARAR